MSKYAKISRRDFFVRGGGGRDIVRIHFFNVTLSFEVGNEAP